MLRLGVAAGGNRGVMMWTAIVRAAVEAVGSQAELARLSEVNRSQVGRWLEGIQRPRPEHCRAVDALQLRDGNGDPLPSLELAVREDLLTAGRYGPLLGGEVLHGRESYSRLGELLEAFMDDPPERDQRVVMHGAWHASGPKAANREHEFERWRFLELLNDLAEMPRREGWTYRYMTTIDDSARLEELLERLRGPWQDSETVEVRLFVGSHPPVLSPLLLGQRVASIAVDDPAMRGVEDSLLLTDQRAIAVIWKSAIQAWDSAPFRIRNPAGIDEGQVEATRQALARRD